MPQLRAPILDAEGNPIAEVIVREHDGRHIVERTTFISSFSREIPQATAIGIRVALLSQDWKTLDAFDPEFLPWYCRRCEQNYHASQWKTSARIEDDGWVDSYRGRCPRGHERMLAD